MVHRLQTDLVLEAGTSMPIGHISSLHQPLLLAFHWTLGQPTNICSQLNIFEKAGRNSKYSVDLTGKSSFREHID